jgi:hypothetical protein
MLADENGRAPIDRTRRASDEDAAIIDIRAAQARLHAHRAGDCRWKSAAGERLRCPSGST